MLGIQDLHPLDEQVAMPSEDVYRLINELGDADIDDQRRIVRDGAKHALAPAGDDLEVGGCGVLQAQVFEIDLVHHQVADEFLVLGR
ncbi:hypothetical protein D9M68_886560 [compost metagenome]